MAGRHEPAVHCASLHFRNCSPFHQTTQKKGKTHVVNDVTSRYTRFSVRFQFTQERTLFLEAYRTELSYAHSQFSAWIDFFLLQNVQTCSRTNKASYLVGLTGPFYILIRPVPKAGLSPACSAEAKNEWSFTPLVHIPAWHAQRQLYLYMTVQATRLDVLSCVYRRLAITCCPVCKGDSP